MTFEPGTKLGRYEIRSKIGAGGMGEVYRAYDSTVHQEVAIKVLPAALSVDKERLARFEQEAQTAGSLHHLNILTIHPAPNRYDVSANGQRFLVKINCSGTELRKGRSSWL
jgi:serine/threonine protein kinase